MPVFQLPEFGRICLAGRQNQASLPRMELQARVSARAWHAGGMSDPRGFVIIGASLAGAKAAETLRKDGFEGTVTLIGDEGERPYERPPLSKEYLRGEEGPEKLFVHKEGYYDSAGIELRLGETVAAIDVDEHAVVLASGERLAYTSLLLTTGPGPAG